MSLATIMSTPLPAQLLAAARDRIAALRREADQHRPRTRRLRRRPSSARMSGVRTSVELQRAPRCLLDLPGERAVGRRVVGDRGGHHDDVGLGRRRAARRRASAARCAPGRFRRSAADRAASARRRAPPARRGARLPRQSRSPCGRSTGCRCSGPVDVLVGRPGGHEDELARAASQPGASMPVWRPRRCRPARPAVPCRSSRRRDTRRPDRRTARRARASVAMLRRTASCSSMFVFMAGAMSTGARVAR